MTFRKIVSCNGVAAAVVVDVVKFQHQIYRGKNLFPCTALFPHEASSNIFKFNNQKPCGK
jgi:hypothetical protein